MWTKWYIVGHTVTHYSFLGETVSREVAGVEGGGYNDKWRWVGLGFLMSNSKRINKKLKKVQIIWAYPPADQSYTVPIMLMYNTHVYWECLVLLAELYLTHILVGFFSVWQKLVIWEEGTLIEKILNQIGLKAVPCGIFLNEWLLGEGPGHWWPRLVVIGGVRKRLSKS